MLTDRFRALREQGRRALVCYITAGHPTADATRTLLRELPGAGADVVELGVPFSDPLADGPIIQASSHAALAGGMTLGRALGLVAESHATVPVVLFTYLNPLMAAGADVLARAHAAGVRGILVTDLPLGADQEREAWIGNGPLEFVRLVAPTTPRARMVEIAKHGSGFVYLISRRGVTGVQDEIAMDLPETVERLRAATDLPICVGFGIGTAEQARAVAKLADGVVVGSAIVRALESGGVPAALDLVRALRRGLDEGAR